MLKFFNLLLSIVFPDKCIVCLGAIDHEGYCDKCKGLIKEIDVPTCFNCGTDLKHCTCDKYIYHFDGLTAPYYNEGLAQQAVYDFKFTHSFRSVKVFSEVMAKRAAKVFGVENIDIITCVPSGRKSFIKRGFNQSEVYAVEVAKHLERPFVKDLLKRKNSVDTQHKQKGVTARFDNVRNGYVGLRSVKGKNILLVDDIKTTGASLDECARQLKICGAEKVYCLTALVSKFSKATDTNNDNLK